MGVLLGNAVVQVGASWCVIHPGSGTQWRFLVVAATIAVIAVLRARAFRDRRHAITVVSGAALSLFAIPTHYGFAAEPDHNGQHCGRAAAVVAIALGALLAGAIVPTPHVLRTGARGRRIPEYVATTLVIVFAAWSIDLLHFVRYH